MGVKDLFAGYKGGKTALYGLGTETEKTLRELEPDYQIIGLLDSFKEDGWLYGKPIISLSKTVEAGVKLIIVVARPGSCRAIAKKIGQLCRQNGIGLLDIRGRDLLEIRKVTYHFPETGGVTKGELREKIQRAEIVSFDLFDTLIMRQTLYSEDIAEYVDRSLREQGIFIEGFSQRRLESEKELSKLAAPTLKEIYENMLAKLACGGIDRSFTEDLKSKSADKNLTGKPKSVDFGDVSAEKLADLEWKIDLRFIVPREEVCSLFRETVSGGKKVYIVSDTYYSKNQLIELLKKCKITEYADILDSSEYKTGKRQNLFDLLRDRERERTCLHVGDDIVADVECAHDKGFETCRLPGGLELLESVGYLGLAGHMDTLSERLKTGIFVAKLFNSPFQFENKGKSIGIRDAYDVGYLLCGPLISDFVLWFYGQVKREQIRTIWFSARDGYLIQKMYAHFIALCGERDRSVYFLTSRVAAIRAGMESEKDIQYVDEMKFSGTLEESLKKRFGIDENDIRCVKESEEDGLLKYKKPILENAFYARKNYKAYINSLERQEGEIAFFDFVAKGTTQMYVQRLVKNHLKGFYFLQLERDSMRRKGVDAESFYAGDDTEASVIFDDYYILETLLTSLDPSVGGFDEKGQPVYEEETRTDKDRMCAERAQRGILDYFKIYMKLCPRSELRNDKKLDEILLKLIHKIKILDRDFLSLVVEDPFFNRMTDITDVIE